MCNSTRCKSCVPKCGCPIPYPIPFPVRNPCLVPKCGCYGSWTLAQ